jgi:hypothetical protein
MNTNTLDFPNSWTEEEVWTPPRVVHFSVLKTLRGVGVRLVVDYNANFLLDLGRTGSAEGGVNGTFRYL